MKHKIAICFVAIIAAINFAFLLFIPDNYRVAEALFLVSRTCSMAIFLSGLLWIYDGVKNKQEGHVKKILKSFTSKHFLLTTGIIVGVFTLISFWYSFQNMIANPWSEWKEYVSVNPFNKVFAWYFVFLGTFVFSLAVTFCCHCVFNAAITYKTVKRIPKKEIDIWNSDNKCGFDSIYELTLGVSGFWLFGLVFLAVHTVAAARISQITGILPLAYYVVIIGFIIVGVLTFLIPFSKVYKIVSRIKEEEMNDLHRWQSKAMKKAIKNLDKNTGLRKNLDILELLNLREAKLTQAFSLPVSSIFQQFVLPLAIEILILLLSRFISM